MARQFINELADGETVDEVYLLADKQLRANRNADLYLLASLRDRTGAISGLMWNVSEDAVAHVDAGDYVKVRGKVQLYQGSLQAILNSVDRVSGDLLDPADFHYATAKDLDRLSARLREILLGIGDEAIRTLMECYLVDDRLMRDFCRAPAGIKAHHAYHGGLLEHVVNMAETAVRIVDLYPDVDFDLLLAGVFLHDLGKIHELSYDVNFSYTDTGQMLGHMSISVEILTEKAAEYERQTGTSFPAETLMRLKHMILSHHGAYEYGSSKLPMTTEAIALHYLDNLDAKIHEFARAIEEDPLGNSNFTPYHQRLSRKIYKGARSED